MALSRLTRRQSDPDDTPDLFEPIDPEDPSAGLQIPPEKLTAALGNAGTHSETITDIIEDHTVNTTPDLDEDAFFTTADGNPTIATRYDLEKAVPEDKKSHFVEIDRYWINEPYAFVVIFRSQKENETKYYLIEPHLSPIEEELKDFLTDKLRTAIKYESDDVLGAAKTDRRDEIIEQKTRELLERYDLYHSENGSTGSSFSLPGRLSGLGARLGFSNGEPGENGHLEGARVRPEPAVLEENATELNDYQVEKLLYVLKRDFVGYERIDGIKHDINVEDVSCDGYNSPVFVYHTEYENIITNVYHGEQELDEFVVKLAQRSGKGISKRQPQVDVSLPDGSRAQLTLGREVSDHGTNYTIRQFKDVPFTPVDLINWRTFSLEQMAFLWLCIENHKSLIFAGGTASGKTTSLNAVSLFIPSNTKIVSIEDTREVELPQRNWIASVTRPGFTEDDAGDIDEFDLLEAALRQRPDYIVMGEIRGEEGRTLFQVMSTGHTTYTTFHADTVGEVLKRFTTEPINVSKTLFTALDLVSNQAQTRLRGRKIRRSKNITEINEYNAEHDEINVQDVYQWNARSDTFDRVGRSNVLQQIAFDRGWSQDRLDHELFLREIVLAYLIRHGFKDYAHVAATIQAFISDQDTVLALMANNQLRDRLNDLREMESVLIDIDEEVEALVPRPDPDEELVEETDEILAAAQNILEDYKGTPTPTLQEFESALPTGEAAATEPPSNEDADGDGDGDGDGEAMEPSEPTPTEAPGPAVDTPAQPAADPSPAGGDMFTDPASAPANSIDLTWNAATQPDQPDQPARDGPSRPTEDDESAGSSFLDALTDASTNRSDSDGDTPTTRPEPDEPDEPDDPDDLGLDIGLEFGNADQPDSGSESESNADADADPDDEP